VQEVCSWFLENIEGKDIEEIEINLNFADLEQTYGQELMISLNFERFVTLDETKFKLKFPTKKKNKTK